MDFSEALKLLKQGATIRRASWSGSKQIKLIHDDRPDLVLPYIRIITKDNRIGVYTATNCDILADDWVLLEAKPDKLNLHETNIHNENEEVCRLLHCEHLQVYDFGCVSCNLTKKPTYTYRFVIPEGCPHKDKFK